MSNSGETKVIDSFEKRNFTDKIISEIKDFDIIETISIPKPTSNNFSSTLEKDFGLDDKNINSTLDTLSTIEKAIETTNNNDSTVSEKINRIFSDNLRDNEINNINIIADYLPKRKVREMLFAKYKIDNDEYVNELYNMAFNKKWKEMDLEQWLSDHNNVKNLFISIKSPLNLKDKELAQKKKFLTQESPIVKSYKVEDGIKNNIEMKKEVKDESMKSNEKNINHISLPARKEYVAHNLANEKHLSNCVDLGFIRENIYANRSDNKVIELKLDHLKNEMRSVYIEEKYKENQIDLQTEKLKNHIDNRFSEFLNNYSYNNNNNSYREEARNGYCKTYDNKFDRVEDRFIKFSNTPNMNNIVIEELKNDILEKMSLLDEKISSIETNYKSNFDSITLNNDEIVDKVSSQIKFAFEEFDKRESMINEQLDETNEKLDDAINIIDEKISSAMNEFNNLNENLSKDLNFENQKIKSSLSTFSDQLNTTNKNLVSFASDLENLKSYVYDKDNFIDSADNVSESFVANILDQLHESNKQINKISNELNELKSMVENDKNHFDINDSIERTINEKIINVNDDISKLKKELKDLLLEKQKNNTKDEMPKNVKNDIILLGNNINNESNANNTTFKDFLKDINNSSNGFHTNKFVDDSKFDTEKEKVEIIKEVPVLLESKKDELPNFDDIDALIKQSIDQLKSLNEVVELDEKHNDQAQINDSINKLESIKEDKNK